MNMRSLRRRFGYFQDKNLVLQERNIALFQSLLRRLCKKGQVEKDRRDLRMINPEMENGSNLLINIIFSTINTLETISLCSSCSRLSIRVGSSSLVLFLLMIFTLSDLSTSAGFIPAFKHLNTLLILQIIIAGYLLVKPAPLTAPPTSPVNPAVSSAFHTTVGLVHTRVGSLLNETKWHLVSFS